MYDPIYRGKKKKKKFLPSSHVCMLKILSILKKKKNNIKRWIIKKFIEGCNHFVILGFIFLLLFLLLTLGVCKIST